MGSIEAAYHADGYAAARPAVNVKVRVPGFRFRSDAVDAALPLADAERIHQQAYDCVQSDFWDAARDGASKLGLGGIGQEGRSGGWLIFTEAPDLEYSARRVEWLDAYRRFVVWVTAELAAAPTKVAALAQSLAMDEAGSRAVNQVVLP